MHAKKGTCGKIIIFSNSVQSGLLLKPVSLDNILEIESCTVLFGPKKKIQSIDGHDCL